MKFLEIVVAIFGFYVPNYPIFDAVRYISLIFKILPKFWAKIFEKKSNSTKFAQKPGHRVIGDAKSENRNENFQKHHLDGLRAQKWYFSMSPALSCTRIGRRIRLDYDCRNHKNPRVNMRHNTIQKTWTKNLEIEVKIQSKNRRVGQTPTKFIIDMIAQHVADMQPT